MKTRRQRRTALETRKRRLRRERMLDRHLPALAALSVLGMLASAAWWNYQMGVWPC